MTFLEYIANNLVTVLIWIFVIAFGIFVVVKKDVFLKNIKKQPLNVFALIFTLSMGVATNLFNPAPLKITQASIVPGQISYFLIPVGFIVLILIVLTSVIFFSEKEIKKKRRRR